MQPFRHKMSKQRQLIEQRLSKAQVSASVIKFDVKWIRARSEAPP